MVGTDKDDEFVVTVNEDRSLTVRTFLSRQEQRPKNCLLKTFLPKETKVVNIYALEGKDRIEIKGDKVSAVRLRIIGGLGKTPLRNDAKRTGWIKLFDDEEGMRVNSEKQITATIF